MCVLGRKFGFSGSSQNKQYHSGKDYAAGLVDIKQEFEPNSKWQNLVFLRSLSVH